MLLALIKIAFIDLAGKTKWQRKNSVHLSGSLTVVHSSETSSKAVTVYWDQAPYLHMVIQVGQSLDFLLPFVALQLCTSPKFINPTREWINPFVWRVPLWISWGSLHEMSISPLDRPHDFRQPSRGTRCWPCCIWSCCSLQACLTGLISVLNFRSRSHVGNPMLAKTNENQLKRSWETKRLLCSGQGIWWLCCTCWTCHHLARKLLWGWHWSSAMHIVVPEPKAKWFASVSK